MPNLRRLRFAALLVALLLAAPGGAAAQDLRESDLDGDGYLTVADLRVLARDLNTLAAAYRGDANGDGKVSPDDVTFLAKVLLKNGNLGENVTELDVASFIAFVTGGPTANSTDHRKKRDQAFFDLVNRNKPNMRVDLLNKSIRKEAGGQTPGDGFVDDGKVYRPPTDAAGRDPEFPPEASRFDALLNRFSGKGKVDLDIARINARRNKILKEGTGGRGITELFNRLDKTTLGATGVSDLPIPDAPDVSIYAGEKGAAAKRPGSGDDRTAFVPRSRVTLKLEVNDARAIRLYDRTTGLGGPLLDAYRRVSAPAGQRPPELLSADVKALSSDPILSQLMLDAASTETIRAKADYDGDKKLTRAELYTWLFKPGTALAILQGKAETVGIKPGSLIAQNYQAIAESAIPEMIRAGVVSRAVGGATLHMVTRPLSSAIASVNDFLYRNVRIDKPAKEPLDLAGRLDPGVATSGGDGLATVASSASPAVAKAMKSAVADFLKERGFVPPEGADVSDADMDKWLKSGIDIRGQDAVDLLNKIQATLPPGTDLKTISDTIAAESPTAKNLLQCTVADAVKEMTTNPALSVQNPELADGLRKFVDENKDSEISKMVDSEKAIEKDLYDDSKTAEATAGGGAAPPPALPPPAEPVPVPLPPPDPGYGE